MKQIAGIALLLAVAGCGADGPRAAENTRQNPSNYTPGVQVSGHVNVGVVRSF